MPARVGGQSNHSVPNSEGESTHGRENWQKVQSSHAVRNREAKLRKLARVGTWYETEVEYRALLSPDTLREQNVFGQQNWF